MDIIEEISKMYRNERGQINSIYNELDSLEKEIANRDKISAKDYFKMVGRIEILKKELEDRKNYINGISDVRELVMDLVLK